MEFFLASNAIEMNLDHIFFLSLTASWIIFQISNYWITGLNCEARGLEARTVINAVTATVKSPVAINNSFKGSLMQQV